MKIAYISQAYPPIINGVSMMLERLADGMSNRGHTVLVLVPSDTGNANTQTYEKLKIVRMKSIQNPKRAYQKFSPWSFNLINSQIRSFKPDIIHTHDVLTLGIFGLCVGSRMNIPVIATLHQLPWFVSQYLPDFPGLKRTVESLLWKYGRMLNKQYQGMIVPTETISQTVLTHGGFRPFVISNGIDIHSFEPLTEGLTKHWRIFEKYDLDPELPIILHVGRLDREKNVETVIRAAAKVMKNIPSQLLIVGDGECRESLMELSRKLGINNYCKFPGFVDMRTDLPELYKISTVFSTASEIETQGLVLLEAMASGLPIVAVDATCVHEVVKDQISGYLTPPGDKAIAKFLIDILNNPAIGKQMGAAGRSIVQEHSSKLSVKKHEKLYYEIRRQYQPIQVSSRIQRFFLPGKS
jgi:1,2-diacylglycerol 3-alpha-glucosyltransferase